VSGYASSSKTSAAVGLGTLCCLLEDRVCGMEGSTHILSANEGKRNATERRTEKLFECIAKIRRGWVSMPRLAREEVVA
jgi:hypothetical protein